MAWQGRHHPAMAGFGALALGDLILGFASFSTITLGSLWYFAWEWIHLRGQFLSCGVTLGTTWQLGLAWLGVLVALPLLAITILLAVRAMELPRRLYRYLRGTPAATGEARSTPERLERIEDRRPRRPSYVAQFWNGPP